MNTNKSVYRYIRKLPALLALFLVAVLLGACATPATPVSPTPQPAPTTTGQGGMRTLPVARAKSFLANQLNLKKGIIQVVGVQRVQWPDSCLGVQTPGTMCAFHVVDGFRITLSVNGQNFEVHSNLDGSQTVLVPNSASTSAGKS